MKENTITEIVKGTYAKIQYICNGLAYYNIVVEDSIYQIIIDSTTDEWAKTHLELEYKAIILMRWIRKGIAADDGSFIQLK